MKYSIIIPTMWLSTDLINMLEIYESIDKIDEIIVIDNNPTKRPNINYKKIKIHCEGKNIYVNPAWNIGVSLSRNENIIIANDDLLLDKGDLNNLLIETEKYLKSDILIGPSKHCFNQMGLDNSGLKIIENNDEFGYGFGTFMIMKKTSYTIIPDDILIFHGDVIQFKTNKTFLFSGIEIKTLMSTTLKSDKKLHNLARLDYEKSKKYDINKLKKWQTEYTK